MRKTIFAFSLLALLAACNTVDGVGQDVKKAGEWTSEKAENVKKKM